MQLAQVVGAFQLHGIGPKVTCCDPSGLARQLLGCDVCGGGTGSEPTGSWESVLLESDSE